MATLCRFLQLLCLSKVHTMWTKARLSSQILGVFTPIKPTSWYQSDCIGGMFLHLTKARREWEGKSECLQQEMSASARRRRRWIFRTASASHTVSRNPAGGFCLALKCWVLCNTKFSTECWADMIREKLGSPSDQVLPNPVCYLFTFRLRSLRLPRVRC